jgi:hypothetical protein
MDLSERRCRHRLRLEHAERLGNPGPELGFDDAFDLGEGKRLHIVLQARERFDVRRRQEVGAA